MKNWWTENWVKLGYALGHGLVLPIIGAFAYLVQTDIDSRIYLDEYWMRMALIYAAFVVAVCIFLAYAFFCGYQCEKRVTHRVALLFFVFPVFYTVLLYFPWETVDQNVLLRAFWFVAHGIHLPLAYFCSNVYLEPLSCFSADSSCFSAGLISLAFCFVFFEIGFFYGRYRQRKTAALP